MLRLGVVSFLNARPLIEGLGPDVECVLDVPAGLAGRLELGEVDVALIPTIDLIRSGGHYRIVSDACIGSDGETMTVRVFSPVPPDRVKTLRADTDSHTSVALATVLWLGLFDCELDVRTLDDDAAGVGDEDAILLIGDKVVDPARDGFGYQVDLGGAWRQHTGLPFVFAVWACRQDVADEKPAWVERVAKILSAARDCGVARAAEIAAEEGPRHGWSVALAERYLTRNLSYTLDPRAVEGMIRFGQLCGEANLVPAGPDIVWPDAPPPERRRRRVH